jgi:CDP-diacylglycerol--serine O-phosphatidyltransferase
MKKNIPNAITLLNLVSGFAATVCASKGYNEYAAFLIMAGMIFDFADGLTARLLKAYSDIGKDLDSLADVVTFGVAPGAMILNLLQDTGMPLVPAFVLAALLPAVSALRLAKFNNDESQTTSFRGLATPGSAFTVVAFVIASEYSRFTFFDHLTSSAWFAGALSIFLSLMMLINVRMFSLKFSHLRFKGNEERYIFAFVSLLLLVLFRLGAPPLIMASYIIISLLSGIISRRRADTTPA